MDIESESPPPKRSRGNLSTKCSSQLTECVREFQLPQQYPSMMPKMNNKTNPNNAKIFTKGIPNILKKSKISTIIGCKNDSPGGTTIMLKNKNGKDLGKIRVQDLPQNIQGKTITLAKKDVDKSPEAIPVKDPNQTITIGLLTPLNILKAPNVSHYQTENSLLSTESNGAPTDHLVKAHANKIPQKNVIILPDSMKMSNKTEVKGRPQVLVLQSGKIVRVTKISGNLSSCVKKLPIHKINQGNKKFYANLSREKKPVESSVVKVNHQVTEAQADKKCSQSVTPDSTTDLLKSSVPRGVTNKVPKSNIKISRIYGPGYKLLTTMKTDLRCLVDVPNRIVNDATVAQKTVNKKAMIVSPRVKESIVSDSEEKTLPESTKQTLSESSESLVQNGNNATRPIKLITNKKMADGSDGRINETTSNLGIVEQALSTVEDKVLREKALKALVECGIGVERMVPICPDDKKPVKDSSTQTSIFGLWESDQFVNVPEQITTVQRINIIEKAMVQTPKPVIANPNLQEMHINGFDNHYWMNTESSELADMVNDYVKDNDEATLVANIFNKSKSSNLQIMNQLVKDFESYYKYDDEGFLDIHKAVLDDDPRAVARYLLVLRGCQGSPDLCTLDGQTSLQLAIRNDASSKIVKILLEAGADPTFEDMDHDSALIMASKRSLPVLMDLISYVKSAKLLDNYDSTGFAALHYCTRNGFKEGAMALISAGANINLRDCRSGRTPLFHAIENENNVLGEMLINEGGDPRIPNYNGHTIFKIMDEYKHQELIELLNQAIK